MPVGEVRSCPVLRQTVYIEPQGPGISLLSRGRESHVAPDVPRDPSLSHPDQFSQPLLGHNRLACRPLGPVVFIY